MYLWNDAKERKYGWINMTATRKDAMGWMINYGFAEEHRILLNNFNYRS